MTLNLAILGAGRWGTHLIRNFLMDPRVRLRAIADPHGDYLQRAAQQLQFLGHEPQGIRLTQDWRQAIACPDLDAVVIVTPAVTHGELIRAALERGCDVLVEKPMTLDGAEARALTAEATARGRILMVDHTYLFHPGADALGQVVRDGRLGQLRYGYASRTHLGPVRRDVDALWDLAIHDLCLLHAALGVWPRRVQAQGRIWLQPQQRTPLSPDGLADLVWAMLEYPHLEQAARPENDGLAVQLHWAWLNPDKQRRLTLVGDRAAVVFDELSATPMVLHEGFLGIESGFSPQGLGTTAIALSQDEPLRRMCRTFVDCVLQRQAPVSDGQLGTALIEVLAALSQSLHHPGAWVEIT